MCHQSLPPPPPNSRPPSHPAWRVNRDPWPYGCGPCHQGSTFATGASCLIMVLLAAGFVAFSAVTVVGVVVIGLLRDAGR